MSDGTVDVVFQNRFRKTVELLKNTTVKNGSRFCWYGLGAVFKTVLPEHDFVADHLYKIHGSAGVDCNIVDLDDE